MTDFLTRLVARTLGSIPVVQARIPSIYEPEAGEQGSAFPQLAIANSPSSTWPSTTANSVELTSSFPSPSVEENSLRTEIAATPVAKSLTDKSLASLSWSPVAVKSEILSPTEAQRDREQDEAEITRSSRSLIGFETSSHENEAEQVTDELSMSTIDRGETNWHEQAIARPLNEQNSKLQDAVSRKEGFLPELSPQNFENYTDRPNEFQAESSPPQTIRVTIGRIEVRAIPSPRESPKPRQSPPVAKLSLSDYLRQGGAR